MPALPKDWPAVVFTHLVAVACTGVAGWFVHTQAAAALPMVDEWQLVADWLRTDSPAGWILAHHNEHRYPAAKAVWAAALTASGGFRVGQYITVGLLTSAAVLLLWTARGLRGYARPTDAILPALLLHLGHSYNLLMSYQLGFALFVYGAAGWVWAAGRLGRGGGWGWAALAGVYGSLVVVSGGFGLVFTPPLVGWALLSWHRRVNTHRRAALILSVLVWVGYSGWIALTLPASAPQPDRTPDSVIAGSVGFLSVGLGPQSAPRWVCGGVALAFVATACVCLLRDRKWDAGRTAVAAVLVGGLLVAAATGYARGHGVAGRFVTPSAVGLAACWLALAGSSFRLPAWVGWVLGPVAAGWLCWANVESGLREGYYTRVVMTDFTRDLHAGLPPVFLAGRYGGSVPVFGGDGTAEHVRVYRRYGFGPFAAVPDDPRFAVVPASGVSVPFVYECPSEEYARSPRAVRLPDPDRAVIGLRMRVDCRVPAGWQRVSLHWRDAAGKEQSAWAYPPWVTGVLHLTFPLPDRPTDLKLVADGVVQPFTVDAVEWMVPD